MTATHADDEPVGLRGFLAGATCAGAEEGCRLCPNPLRPWVGRPAAADLGFTVLLRRVRDEDAAPGNALEIRRWLMCRQRPVAHASLGARSVAA